MTRCLVCLAWLSVAVSGMAAESAKFRFSKPIDRSPATVEALVAVAFDADVYAATRPDFPDLRIFDGQGREVPCLVEKVTETRTHTVRGTCTSHVVSLHEQADGVEVIIQLEDAMPTADGLTIYTPLQNFERRVRVLGREEGMGWTTLVADGVVFDYSRYIDLSNREIRLPKNKCRQLKINIAGIADASESPLLELTRKYRGGKEAERTETTVLERRPFRMDRIELWHETDEKFYEYDKKTDYPVEQYRVEENAAEKSTIVYVRTRREPLTGLTLETSDRNFSRSAVVEAPVERGVRKQWVEIGRDRLSLLDFGKYHRRATRNLLPRTTRERISHRDPQRGQSAACDHRRQGAGQRLSRSLSGGREGNLSPWLRLGRRPDAELRRRSGFGAAEARRPAADRVAAGPTDRQPRRRRGFVRHHAQRAEESRVAGRRDRRAGRAVGLGALPRHAADQSIAEAVTYGHGVANVR